MIAKIICYKKSKSKRQYLPASEDISKALKIVQINKTLTDKDILQYSKDSMG